MACSTFLPDNLPELHTLLPQALPYPPIEAYEEVCRELHFRYYQLSPLEITLHFPTLLELLRHLKATGANGVTPPSTLWTPQKLRTEEQQLRQQLALAADDLLPLTYHALSIIAIK